MPKPLKIAHVVRRYSSAEWGGTETVVCHTVAEQRKLGHEPRIFCTAALQSAASPISTHISQCRRLIA